MTVRSYNDISKLYSNTTVKMTSIYLGRYIVVTKYKSHTIYNRKSEARWDINKLKSQVAMCIDSYITYN